MIESVQVVLSEVTMNSTKPYVQTQSRQDTLSTLRNDARSADLRNDEKFRAIICACRYVLEMSDAEIGDALHVSRPTVSRWINGKSIPHPMMRKPIFDWIGAQAAKKLRILEADKDISSGAFSESYSASMAAKAR